MGFPDRYVRELTGEKLADFIMVKLEPTSDEDVFPFRLGFRSHALCSAPGELRCGLAGVVVQ